MTSGSEPAKPRTFTLPYGERVQIYAGDSMAVLGLIESVAAWLMANVKGFATLTAGPSFNFVQMMINDDGSIYIESTKAGDLAKRGEQGWDNRWEFCGGTDIGPYPGQERMAAEKLTRALIELHELELPATFTVFAEAAGGNPVAIERPPHPG